MAQTDFPPLPKPSGLVLPRLDCAALFLDLDGTLLDIAPAPDQVVVPADLPTILRKVRAAAGEALAIVSGRPIQQLDALLPGIAYAVAGEHGTAIRHAPDQPIEHATLPGVPPEWLAEARRLADANPGVLLEPKQHGFVLHYRALPAAGPVIGAGLRALVDNDPRFALMPALMAWEVRPVATDKGTAAAALMRRPPFLGKRPIFIGDDVTDEDGMRACVSHGGAGLRVADAFGTAEAVRGWLGSIGVADPP